VTNGSGPGSESRVLAPGSATAEALVLGEPLSLWGGVDPASGRIIDRRHREVGQSVTGKILVMPSGRGSSSSSSILAEAVRAGTGPVGIVLREPDPILALGSVVAALLYGTAVPVVTVPETLYRILRTGVILTIHAPEAGRPAEIRNGPV
jgi:uncharacterized protein